MFKQLQVQWCKVIATEHFRHHQLHHQNFIQWNNSNGLKPIANTKKPVKICNNQLNNSSKTDQIQWILIDGQIQRKLQIDIIYKNNMYIVEKLFLGWTEPDLEIYKSLC